MVITEKTSVAEVVQKFPILCGWRSWNAVGTGFGSQSPWQSRFRRERG